MIGTIESANPSKSGKTLSVKVSGQWYTTKNWELQNMMGQNVIFEPSSSEFNGQVMHWLNDYQLEGTANTPATAAMSAAMGAQQNAATHGGVSQQPYATDPLLNQGPPQGHPAAPVSPPAATSTGINKDHLIGALALVKATPGDALSVWNNFVFFYEKLKTWNPDEFNDEIPF